MENKEKNISQNLMKIKIITNVVIIILLIVIIIILQRSGILGNASKIGKNSNSKLLNNGEMLISEDGTVKQTVNSSNWDISKVTVVKDADGKEVPVPKGYVGSSFEGENRVSQGYVIYEGTAEVTSSNLANARRLRNQWVWVPVPDASRIYEEVNGVKRAKLYSYTGSGRSEYENRNFEPAVLPEIDTTTNLTNGGLSGMTPDKLHQELGQEFDSTMESIERYGGFYIGRYETGNLSQNTPVVRKMNTDITNQTWYTMYSKMGYLAVNSNVKTNMIWGCLWDETLQWLVDTTNRNFDELINSSSNWGNYNNSTFIYNNGSSDVTKPINQSVKIPTGSTEYTKALNIYDLSGNAWEFTLEGTNTCCRVFRGAGFNNINVASISTTSRITKRKPIEKLDNIGCRAYLYIK